MDPTDPPAPKSLLARLKARFNKPKSDTTRSRLRRVLIIEERLSKWLPYIKFLLFTVGFLWVLALPLAELGKETYIDENALSPGHIRPQFAWADVHSADRWLDQLEKLRDSNATSEKRAEFISDEFRKLGLLGATQKYTLTLVNETRSGVNAYAVSPSPRISGTEAMVISASWIGRKGEGNGDLNLRGVAILLALAKYLKGSSSWAKDLVFVVSDGYLDGMQAWLNAYHGTEQKNLKVESLPHPSGVIWNALSIDYACHSFSHLGIFHEGVNGRLPNQDLINSFERLSRWTGGVPVVMYDHLGSQLEPPVYPSWIPKFIRQNKRFESYWQHGRNTVRHIGYQARGRPSGIHGLFHRHRIDAFTMYAICAQGPHGFYAMGRVVEATLTAMNNLLERLHASFFFYLLTGPYTFLKISSYLPSPVLISVAMMIQGLTTWSQAGWVLDVSGKTAITGPAASKWITRRRDVLPVAMTMFFTHVWGLALFAIVSTSWYIKNIQQAVSLPVFVLFASLPLSILAITRKQSPGEAPVGLVLKALNVCFASPIISITSVLNFSLALSFAMLLGIPLSISAWSRRLPVRIASYSIYALLALGWVLFLPEETKTALWHWEIASAWFAPVVCVVYAPLVLQAGIATLLTR
ncbi:Gaa1-domain-containing protein [Coprinopsis marcescibilis]|uniref:Gaa1-domain-containing protein n=1 Tax=Coprinopsis marcescibilis TaxID=230819 RepID=A0A5C3LAR0_COPMA|nr:Gaa1-domain-containing protein [Coprinopsis marcescibilis]